MTIFEKYQRVKNLNSNLRLVGMDAMIATREQFLELNRDQMTAGWNSDDSRIGRYQSDSYARFKRLAFPQSGGWVNLRYTGSFQDKMRLVVNAREWKVTSDDGKAAKLTEKYGRNVFGLAPQQLQEYRSEYFYPALMERINRQLNG